MAKKRIIVGAVTAAVIVAAGINFCKRLQLFGSDFSAHFLAAAGEGCGQVTPSANGSVALAGTSQLIALTDTINKAPVIGSCPSGISIVSEATKEPKRADTRGGMVTIIVTPADAPELN